MTMRKRLSLAFSWLLVSAMMAFFIVPAFQPLRVEASTFLNGFLRDSSNNLLVNCAVGCGSASTPFAGGSTGNALGANQAIGVEALNDSTNLSDTLHLDASGNLKVTNTGSTVTLNSWTPIIVSGNTTDAFGATVCPSGACGIQLKSGPGVISSLQWNSATAMGAATISCWNAIGAGTIHTEVFFATGMSSGGVWPIPSGGYAFSIGLWCQTSGFISTTQNFAFGVR
jgi:hypothetical protein